MEWPQHVAQDTGTGLLSTPPEVPVWKLPATSTLSSTAQLPHRALLHTDHGALLGKPKALNQPPEENTTTNFTALALNKEHF